MKSKEYEFPSARFVVHERYIVAEPKKHLDVSFDEVGLLYDLVKKHIKEEPFGLIECRPRETSIDPMVYRQAKKAMPNFVAFALVSQSEISAIHFDMEKKFMKNMESKLCATLEEAVQWMESVV